MAELSFLCAMRPVLPVPHSLKVLNAVLSIVSAPEMVAISETIPMEKELVQSQVPDFAKVLLVDICLVQFCPSCTAAHP